MDALAHRRYPNVMPAMLPFEIPPGTTLESFVTEVVPAAHAKLVSKTAAREPFVCALELEGLGHFRFAIDGGAMKVSRVEDHAPDARIRASAAIAQAFLDDFAGPGSLAPKWRPEGDVVLLSDPQMLKRFRMVTGTIELTVVDFPIGNETREATLRVAMGAPARKIDPDPDVVVRTSMKTYTRLIAGSLRPDEALVDGDVQVQKKRLVAMQFALAVAPLFPAR